MTSTEIRSVIEKMDAEIVKDALSIMLENKTSGSTQVSHDQTTSVVSEWDRINNFFDFMQLAKKKFEFPEMDAFSVENGAVFFELRGRKHMIAELPQEPVTRTVSSLVNPSSEGDGRFGKLEL